MPDDQYDPPEYKIAALLEERTPRQLAIGYLRAARRASQAEHAFMLLDSLAGTSSALAMGDLAGAKAHLDEAKRRSRDIPTKGDGASS